MADPLVSEFVPEEVAAMEAWINERLQNVGVGEQRRGSKPSSPKAGATRAKAEVEAKDQKSKRETISQRYHEKVRARVTMIAPPANISAVSNILGRVVPFSISVGGLGAAAMTAVMAQINATNGALEALKESLGPLAVRHGRPPTMTELVSAYQGGGAKGLVDKTIKRTAGTAAWAMSEVNAGAQWFYNMATGILSFQDFDRTMNDAMQKFNGAKQEPPAAVKAQLRNESARFMKYLDMGGNFMGVPKVPETIGG